ncbi:MAG TPA: hypothetical protein VNI61_09510 [Gemmatimonadales bacterium]|nr:hypothetical protein [Gemmatimonadales bacterium]
MTTRLEEAVTMSLTRAVPGLLAGALLLTTACSDTSAPGGPDAAAMHPQAAPRAPSLATLAGAIPGFGGLYLEAGVPTVYLTDLGQEGAARAVLGRYGFSGVRAVQGQFAYQDLDRWFQLLSREGLALPGTVLADLDEAANRVLIGVEHAAAAASIRGLAARLGVPAAALVVREMEPIGYAATLRDRIDPRIGGIQIHFSNFLCTLGFNASDGGEASFITNSHCTDRQGGVESTVYYQPLQSVDGTSIGTEVEDPAYQRNIPGCPRGKRCRRSDAARAAYHAGISFDPGRIARTSGPNTGSLDIVGFFDFGAEDLRDNFTVGETLNKVGRTTGWTQGTVSNTCVTVSVSGTNIAQICQTIVSNTVQIVGGGDSGSPVFVQTGASTANLSGILWGGNSSGTLFVFSPLKNIEQELGNLATL